MKSAAENVLDTRETLNLARNWNENNFINIHTSHTYLYRRKALSLSCSPKHFLLKKKTGIIFIQLLSFQHNIENTFHEYKQWFQMLAQDQQFWSKS